MPVDINNLLWDFFNNPGLTIGLTPNKSYKLKQKVLPPSNIEITAMILLSLGILPTIFILVNILYLFFCLAPLK